MTVEGIEEISVHVADVALKNRSNKFKHLIDAVIDFTSGTLGGFANCMVAQPFDTVKVKLQTFPADYNGTVQCFTNTYVRDGLFRGLYAGTVPALIAHVAENAVLFTCYGLCQKTVMSLFSVKSVEEMSIIHSGLAGSGASVFSSMVLCPTELVKCRLQASRNMLDSGRIKTAHAYNNTFSLCRHIMKTDGVLGFYRGLSGTLVREIPGYFCFFGGYELSRTLLADPGQSKADIGPLKTMISGGVGGMSLWVVIYPVDSVKSRQQVYTHLAQPAKFFPTLKSMIREEGVSSLYRGLAPTILRTFLATGALFYTYENTKLFFHDKIDNLI